MRFFWVSCSKFTVCIDTDNRGNIVEAAPICKVFVGQPLRNLCVWASKFSKVDIVELKGDVHEIKDK